MKVSLTGSDAVFLFVRSRYRLCLCITLLLSPLVVTAAGSGVPSVSIPSIPGPGLDRDCVGKLDHLSDREAARRVHACSKPYQPGPDGDARLQAAHLPVQASSVSGVPHSSEKTAP